MKPRSTKSTQARLLEPWIETYTGKKFYFLDPKPEQIDIRDIAHSLAYTCRWTGHCRRWYSVAEHSLYVSYLSADPFAGLMHDAAEAYLGDLASPMKDHVSNFKDMENTIMKALGQHFNFNYLLGEDVHDADNVQLKTEARHLLKSGGADWVDRYPTIRTHGIKPECLSPEAAEMLFLERFEEVSYVSVDKSDWPYNKNIGVHRNPASSNGLDSKNNPSFSYRELRE